MTSFKVGKVWRYEFQMNYQRYTEYGFKTKKECEAAEAARRKKVKRGIKTNSAMDFRTVAYDYLDIAKRQFAEKTYKQKRFVLKSFIKHTGNLQIEHIRAGHLQKYLITRPSNNNYNAHRKDLCSLFTHAKRVLRVIQYNPCWDLDKMPHTPKVKYIPSEKDILKLVAAANPKTDDRDLIVTILYTAARVDEILRLQWKDINMEKQTLTRWTRKRKGGSYESIICHMNNDLYSIMQKRWKARKNEIWVFYNEKTDSRFKHRPKLMKGLCKRAEIEPAFGFHNLRHFIASYLADKEKISKKTIGGLLGHKSLQTTEIYLHPIDGQEQDALDRLNGMFGT